MHRDIKPANILLDKSFNIKLCDFGLARLVTYTEEESIAEFKNNPLAADSNIDNLNDIPSNDNKLTEYVVTRWYRAPEVSLSNGKYSFDQDVWSTAVTFAELLTRRPLFPGRSYIHQIKVIIDVLGVKNARDIDFEMDPNGRKLVQEFVGQVQSQYGLRDKIKPSFHIYNVIVWEYTLTLLSSMLSFNPNNRITASQALRSPLFAPFAAQNVEDSLPMIPFLYMKDIEQSNENIQVLRQLLQTEVAKSSTFGQPTGLRSTSKPTKRRLLVTSSSSSVSPYLSKKPFEELKDEFIKSDLDDRGSSVRKFKIFDYQEMAIDSNQVQLKSPSKSSPLITIRKTLGSIIPWFNQRNDSETDNEDKINSIEKNKIPTLFCCLPRSISTVSP